MKLISTSVFLLFLTTGAMAQQSGFSYLVITMHEKSDEYYKNYVEIHADPGNPEAQDVYRLVEYKPGKKNRKHIAGFFSGVNDSTVLYNYFINRSQALNFLSSRRWELLSVSTENWPEVEDISGIGEPKNEVIKTYSRSVYYLRKWTRPLD